MDLKAEIPTLEPDPVLLSQLSQLSATSLPPRREGPVRLLVAAVTVLVLALFSWLTGALPGVASPFDGVRHHHSAPQQQTPESPTAPLSGGTAAQPLPGTLPPGQVRMHHDNGNHFGLAKPNHHDNGNHTGLTDGQANNGNHTGQTKAHQNSGHHTGQTKPHSNNGHHTGQTKPHPNNSQATTAPTIPPGANGNGHGDGNGNSNGSGEGNGHKP